MKDFMLKKKKNVAVMLNMMVNAMINVQVEQSLEI